MNIDFQKVADAMEGASNEVREFMLSTEISEKIGSIIEKARVDDDLVEKIFDEVGYVILGLKSKFSFHQSLVDIGVDKDIAASIAKEIEQQIFIDLEKIKTPEKQGEEKVEPNKNSIEQSFEELILNQARAMQPAREAPANLPTRESEIKIETQEEEKKEESKTQTSHYSGQDPYREPPV